MTTSNYLPLSTIAFVFMLLCPLSIGAQTCPPSQALRFPASNDFINCGNPANNLFSFQNNGTIEAWVKVNSSLPPHRSGTCNVVLGKDEGSGSNLPKWFFGLQNGGLAFHINGAGYGGGFWVYSTLFAQPANGIWYHVAMTKQANTYTFYLNGTPIGTSNLTNPIVNINAPLTIGWGEPCCQSNETIDELKFWNTVRTETEVRADRAACPAPNQAGLIAFYPMNEGAGQTTIVDRSQFSNNGILTNMNAITAWQVGLQTDCSGQMTTRQDTSMCRGDSIFIQNRWLRDTGTYTFRSYTAPDSCLTETIVQIRFKNQTPVLLTETKDSCLANSAQISVNTQPSGSLFYWTNGQTTSRITVSQSGSYSVRVTSPEGCTTADTIAVELITANLVVSTPSPVCANTVVQIHVQTNKHPLSIRWINGDTLPTITITALRPMTVSVIMELMGSNLIKNGDFENGNRHFKSDYIFSPTGLSRESTYLIGNSGRAGQLPWSSCAGRGQMLLVNGSGVPQTIVWESTVRVEANRNYAFSAMVATMFPRSPAQLQFSINGIPVGNVFSAPNDTCVWQQFFVRWTASPMDSVAVIRILNQNTSTSGNDFALDDIAFAPICTVEKQVFINVLPPTTTNLSRVSCNPNQIGSTRDTLVSILRGCRDSIVITTTALINVIFIQKTDSVCLPSQVGIRRDTFQSVVTGCDSIVETRRVLRLSNPITSLNRNICAGETLIFNDTARAVSGIYRQLLRTAAGCDSTVVLNLTVQQIERTNTTTIVCRRSAVGIKEDTIRNTQGCIVEIRRTISTLSAILPTVRKIVYRCDIQRITFQTDTLSGVCDTVVTTETRPDSILLSYTVRQPTCSKNTGQLVIQQVSAAAILTIDGKNTPLSNLPILVENLSIGTHRLQVEKIGGCVLEKTVDILPARLLTLKINMPSDTIIGLGDSLILKINPNFKPLIIKWLHPPKWLCDSCLEQVIKPTHNRLYTLQLTDSSGCVVSASFKVQVQKPAFLPPNTYVPDVEGLFLVHSVKGMSIERVQIFERNGGMVYQSEMPYQATNSWDGKVRGAIVPTQVFVVKYIIRWLDGEVETVAYPLEVIR